MPEFLVANFPFDAFTETAVIKEDYITKTDGISTINYMA